MFIVNDPQFFYRTYADLSNRAGVKGYLLVPCPPAQVVPTLDQRGHATVICWVYFQECYTEYCDQQCHRTDNKLLWTDSFIDAYSAQYVYLGTALGNNDTDIVRAIFPMLDEGNLAVAAFSWLPTIVSICCKCEVPCYGCK